MSRTKKLTISILHIQPFLARILLYLLLRIYQASYDNSGLDRYTSPGAGAITPWFNRSSTARWDIEAGSELFVDYGQGMTKGL